MTNEPKWEIRRREFARGRIPYGYEVSPEDPHILIPKPHYVVLIEQGFDLLNEGTPFREVAEWLSKELSDSISHSGLKKIWLERRGHTPEAQARMAKNKAPKKKPKRMSWEERRVLTAKQKAAKERAQITRAKTRLAKLEEVLEVVEEPKEIKPPNLILPEEEPVDTGDVPIAFKPNPGPQTLFLSADEREVLYGGAAGGGKSYALLADPMRYFSNPNFRGLILRRTNDELRELIMKANELYSAAFPGTKWSEQRKEFRFPSPDGKSKGGTLWMTYLERDMDVLRYQGQAYNYIAFDELTQHPTPYAWDYMRTRLRTTDPTLPLFMRATTNPGGPGHAWVKKMFVDPAPPGKPFPATDIETGEMMVYPEGHAKAGEPLFYRRFIPASLYDNPYLAEDGQYEASLLGMPDHLRRQLLEGDWSISAGAAFPEFRPNFHVIEPYEIPYDWRRFRACDYGYSTFSAVLWFAVDPATGQLVVYDELYVSKYTGADLANAILEKEAGQKIDYGVLDSSCWHERGSRGPTVAEELNRRGCRFRPSDRSPRSRVNGRLRLHELLKPIPDATGTGEVPGIVFFNTCRQIIADLPMIPTDPKGGDDIDARFQSDHTYDALRYGIMSRPKTNSIFDFSEFAEEYSPADKSFGY